MIIAVISEKGGTGKTTIAIHLAGWRTAAGRDVILIDADRQGTATYWAQARESAGLFSPIQEQSTGRPLRRMASRHNRLHDDVVVDVGAGDGLSIESLLSVADVAVVPLQPNALDIWTVGVLDRMASAARRTNSSLTCLAVLNRAPTHHADTDAQAAHRALQECDIIEDTGITIRERSSIRRAVPEGLLVDEWTPHDRRGYGELREVYRAVFQDYDEESKQ